MKNLISVILVVFLPLTLASQTQHRFQVYVIVSGENDTITSILSSHLKRELRALGDVDIVGWDDDWEYALRVFYLEEETIGGVKTGWVSIAYIVETRVAKAFLSDAAHEIKLKAVYPGTLGVAHWHRDNLQEWCISAAGKVNDSRLEFVRSLRRK